MKPSFKATLAGAALSVFVITPVLADMPVAEPLKHAPIGVMGDHRHHAGEWMTSYRFMRMEMRGLRDGTNDVSPTDIFVPGKPPTFPVAPTRMTMDMHMLGAMYGWSHHITLMAMVPWLENEMDHHVTPMPANNFTTKTEGLGDVKLSALMGVETDLPGTTHITLGVSLPTGSIDEKGQTPAGYVVLPYPMQLGSGTYDALIGGTWQNGQGDWAWGAQYSGVIRLGEN
ncbi:MAG: transporter, partial [Alphaproteobacteria bacterium]